MYQISNFGNIKSFKRKREKKLKPFIHNSGYKAVNLRKNGKRTRKFVHRLLAESFIPNPQKYPVINHIDGNKSNNSINNLEWCTQKHNVIEGYRLGRRNPWLGKFGSEHCLSKPINQYDLNRNFIKKWSCAQEVERKLGFQHANIRACCIGIRKTAYGYIWEDIKNG